MCGDNVTHVGLCGGCPRDLGLMRLLPVIFAINIANALLLLFFKFLPCVLNAIRMFPALNGTVTTLNYVNLLNVVLCVVTLFVSDDEGGRDIGVNILDVHTTFARLVNCNYKFLST